jgi:hypothetical protein
MMMLTIILMHDQSRATPDIAAEPWPGRAMAFGATAP